MTTLQGNTVGFIGLDVMGKRMAQRIKDAGAMTYAYNEQPAMRYEIARSGINLCASPSEIASKTAGQLIILMLGNDENMDEIMQGQASLMEQLAAGTLIIDMGQTSIVDTNRYATLARSKGARWLDAPVYGADLPPNSGEIEIIAGGRVEDYQRALPIFQCLAQKISHAGDIGSGQAQILTLQN